MSLTKNVRNKAVALLYFSKGFSIREIAQRYRRNASTIQRLIARYRAGFTPEQIRNMEANRKRFRMQYRYGKRRPRVR